MNIYVGNLPWSIDDQQLEDLFKEHGEVTSARVITDRFTKRSRGFGFVEMETGAEDAIPVSYTHLTLPTMLWV